jgi:hypothetical protein
MFNISGATLIRRSYYYQQDMPLDLIQNRFAFCLLAMHGSSIRSVAYHTHKFYLGASPYLLSLDNYLPACLLSTPMLKLEQLLVSKPLRYGMSLSLLRLFLYRSNLYGCALHWKRWLECLWNLGESHPVMNSLARFPLAIENLSIEYALSMRYAGLALAIWILIAGEGSP